MSSRRKPELRLDWCSHEAAKYAVEHWHYSGALPPPPRTTLGVWENKLFIGAVVFSRGANKNMLKPFGLDMTDGCELTRVALSEHANPVTKILSVALRALKQKSPGLRLIVSYADPAEGHIGGIYQGGNWVFCGVTPPSHQWVDNKTGKKYHPRVISTSGYETQFGVLKKCRSTKGLVKVAMPGKFRYLYPLDKEMAAQIEPLRKPYPKKRVSSIDSDASGLQPGEGGAIPTDTLHCQELAHKQ